MTQWRVLLGLLVLVLPACAKPGPVVVGPGKVAAFVLVGMGGRTALSCDDGRTWIYDQTPDPLLRCDVVDCGHHEGNATGLAFGQGGFVAAFGWGTPGRMVRTTDGATWTKVSTNTNTHARIAFGAGRFMAGGNVAETSTDGITWTEVGPYNQNADSYNIRGMGFVPWGNGGHFVAYFETTGLDIRYTDDHGASWKPTVHDPGCVRWYDNGTAAGNGLVLARGVLSASGVVCRSTDGGATWLAATNVESSWDYRDLLFDGQMFVFFTGTERWTTTDGVTFDRKPVVRSSGGTPQLMVTARDPSTGTYVAVGGAYEKQHFYRSTDGGLTWDELPASAAKGGHPARFIQAGAIDALADCPAPKP